MGTWFSGARKDPVVVWMALSALLQEFEHFRTYRQSTFRVLCFPTHDQDRPVEEVEVRIGHPKLRFASLLQFLGSNGLEVLDHALRDLIEESVLEQLQKGLEAVGHSKDRP